MKGTGVKGTGVKGTGVKGTGVKGTGFSSPYIEPAKGSRGFSPRGASFPPRKADLREQQGRFSREDWEGAAHLLPTYLYTEDTPRLISTGRTSAYIKIAEGCDHPCTFCVIPNLRGKFRSRRFESVVAEAPPTYRHAASKEKSPSSARTPPATAKTSASKTASPPSSTNSPASRACAGSASSTPTPTASPTACSTPSPATTTSANISTSPSSTHPHPSSKP